MISHLSYSSVNHYLLCPRSWRYHYIDRVKVPTAPALIFGSAFHSAVEAYILNTKEDIATAWETAWESTLGERRNQNVAWDEDDTEESMRQLGLRMLTADKVEITGSGPPTTMTMAEHLQSIVPVNRESVERRIESHIPDVPVPLIGYIDVITEDGVPADFKTSSRKWYKKKAEQQLQPDFYLAALNQAGFDVRHGQFRFYVFPKTKKQQAQIIEVHRTRAQLLWMLSMVHEVWRCIEAGVFPPRPGGWKCSPKYCDFWERCRG